MRQLKWGFGLAIFAVFTVLPVNAASICNTVVNTVIVTGPSDSFCVSDFGWSNTWFIGGYDTSHTYGAGDTANNLLGDSAQYITYQKGATVYKSWLLPNATNSLDTNNDGSPDYNVATNFSVTTGVHFTDINDPTFATSVIHDSNIQITVDTSAETGGIRQVFHISNQTSSNLTNIRFVQYLNYNPNGQSNATTGTVRYEQIPNLEDSLSYGLWFDGTDDSPSLIHNGGTCGGPGASCSTPNSYTLGTPTNVVTTIAGNPSTLGNGATSFSRSPSGGSGALMWSLPNLGAHLSEDATVELLPEPGTIWMGAGALVGLVLRRRFRK